MRVKWVYFIRTNIFEWNYFLIRLFFIVVNFFYKLATKGYQSTPFLVADMRFSSNL